ncbi:mms19 nucleotide excision repair [Homalodisca vitripennis]|nr:mms19 nucleotide excision repair [Homalodisca vitripennis]
MVLDYRSTSSEFLFNVISSIDGERDPRNLLILFSFLPKLYSSIPLGPLTEDAFEVVSCYFPIDFHSSGAEPGAVTREDLVQAITPCLLAVPDFAIFCIPLIQEKLDSTLKSAKIDSYNLLMEGCRVWSAETIAEYTEQLWLAVKQDTLPPRDTQIADCAAQALEALVCATPADNLTPLLTSLIRSCEGFLSDVQLSLFEPSSRLLLVAMQASLAACTFISNRRLAQRVPLRRKE